MRKDPKKRIGSKSKEEIKNDPFFRGVDWKKVYEKQYEAPEDFVTRVEDTEVAFIMAFLRKLKIKNR